MEKFCRECGAQLEPDMKFCANCGAAANSNQAVEDNSDNPYSRQQMINQPPAYAAIAAEDNAQNSYDYADNFNGSDAKGYQAMPESQLKHIPALYEFLEKFSIGRWLNHEVYVTEGRLNRWAYFKNCMLNGLLYLAVLTIAILACGICSIILADGLTTMLFTIVAIAVSIFFIPGGYMLGVRRLHDLNRPGWVVLLSFLPYVNVPLSLYMLFFKGTDGANQYGEDPLARL